MKKLSYRELMNEEIVKQFCLLCGDTFIRLEVHHIDGNHKNNKRENLLCVCKKCHFMIERGLKPRYKKLSDEAKQQILIYRAIILKKKFNYTKKEIEERLKYELFIAGNKGSRYLSKKKCYVCSSKRNLQKIIPVLIKKYHPNPDVYAFTICKKCLKNVLSM